MLQSPGDETIPDAGAAAATAALNAGGGLLVTRLRYTGDVLLSLPLLAAARRSFPAARLHVLVEPEARAVLEAQPEITQVWTAPRGVASTVGLARRLRRERFAAAIDLFCNPRSALLVFATGAPVRIGEARRVRRYAYTTARHLRVGRSALEQHLESLRALGVDPGPPVRPVLHLRPAEFDRGRAHWGRWTSHPGVVLPLGATQLAKEWPLEHAIELVRRLGADGVPVLLTTAPNRNELTSTVAARAPGACRVLPVLPLREVWSVLAAASAVVGVDGGIVHASVALGRPTIALFGPTIPEIWFPYEAFGPYRVLHAGMDCGACDRVTCPTRKCMAALEPERVHALLASLTTATATGAAP